MTGNGQTSVLEKRSGTCRRGHLVWRQWSGLCKIDSAQDNGERQHADESREGEDTMDFGIILLVSNTLMAIFIYVVVKLIWQD